MSFLPCVSALAARRGVWPSGIRGVEGRTLGIVCAEDSNVPPYIEAVVKEAVKNMPSMANFAKEMFPEFDLSGIAAEASAEEL